MGRSVCVVAQLHTPGEQPNHDRGYLFLPFVNGRRWGRMNDRMQQGEPLSKYRYRILAQRASRCWRFLLRQVGWV